MKMKISPILFSDPMVRALLDSSKTQTRRIIKPQPHSLIADYFDLGKLTSSPGSGPFKPGWDSRADELDTIEYNISLDCPYGSPGDLLWVREGLQRFDITAQYAATLTPVPGKNSPNYHASGRACWTWEGDTLSPIRMPQWASRTTLRLTDVRVERVQEITDSDVVTEGFPIDESPPHDGVRLNAFGRRIVFSDIWDGTYGWDAWTRNDWVWALSFEVIQQNVNIAREEIETIRN